MHIQQRAMLVTLNIRQWTGRKYDKNASTEVEIANAATDAGRFNKQLLDKKLLADVAKLTGQIREYHYTNTLAWSDNGDRLLPSSQYFKYTATMRTMRDQFSALVSQVAQRYPAEVQAARQRLGRMYNPDDYPDVSSIYARFDVSLSFMPMPDAQDFRVDIGQEAVDEIRTQITEALEQRQRTALNECWTRLNTAVQHMIDKLSDPKAVFRDSLVENLRELVELLPKLNFTDDQDLTDVCNAVRYSLLIDPDRLRADPQLRKDTADTAQMIKERIGRAQEATPASTHLVAA